VVRSIQLYPRSPNAFNNLGSISYHLQRVGEADAAWLEALRLDPSNLSAAMNRAVVLGATGKFPEAAQQLELILQRDPNNVAVLVNLANAYLQMGRNTEALSRVQQALQIAPQHPGALQIRQALTQPPG